MSEEHTGGTASGCVPAGFGGATLIGAFAIGDAVERHPPRAG